MIAALEIYWLIFASLIAYFNYRMESWLNLRTTVWFSLGALYIFPFILGTPEWADDSAFLSIILIGLILFSFWYLFFRFGLTKKPLTERVVITKTYVIPFYILVISAIIQTAITVYPVIVILIKDGLNGFLHQLVQDRVGEYLEDAIYYNYYIATFRKFIGILLLIGVAATWNKKRKFAIYCYALLLVDLIINAHTRFVIIAHLFILLFIYQEYYKPIKVKHLLLVLLATLFIISVGNFVRTGMGVNSETLYLAIQPDAVSNQFLRAGSGSVDSFYQIYEKLHTNQEEIEWFKQYYYYLPLSLIPRALWDDKPIVSYFWRVTSIIESRNPGAGQPVLTTTYLGEAYHEGGFIGIILLSALYFIIARLLFRLASTVYGLQIIPWLFVINAPMHLRGGFNSVLISSLLLILFSIAAFFLARYLGVKRNAIRWESKHYF